MPSSGYSSSGSEVTSNQVSVLIPDDGWDDLVSLATGINPAGVTGPATYNPDESTWDFNTTSTQRIDVSFQMPHTWVAGTEIRFHLHVVGSTSEANKVSRWIVKWRALKVQDPTGSITWTTDDPVLIPVAQGTGAQVLGIKNIDMTGYNISSVVQIQLTRTGNDAADTYGGTIRVASLDLHYRKNKALGSTYEWSFTNP